MGLSVVIIVYTATRSANAMHIDQPPYVLLIQSALLVRQPQGTEQNCLLSRVGYTDGAK